MLLSAFMQYWLPTLSLLKKQNFSYREASVVQKVEKALPWSQKAWIPDLILLLCKPYKLLPLSGPVSWLVIEREYQLLHLVVEKNK